MRLFATFCGMSFIAFSSKVTNPHLLFLKCHFPQAPAAFAVPARDCICVGGKLHAAAAAAQPQNSRPSLRRSVCPVPAQHREIRPDKAGQVLRLPSRFSHVRRPSTHHVGLTTGPMTPTLNTSSVRPKPRIAPPVGAGLAHLAAFTPWGLSSNRRNPHPSHSLIVFHRDPADHIAQPAQFLRLHPARHNDRLDEKPVLKNDVRRSGFCLPDT